MSEEPFFPVGHPLRLAQELDEMVNFQARAWAGATALRTLHIKAESLESSYKVALERINEIQKRHAATMRRCDLMEEALYNIAHAVQSDTVLLSKFAQDTLESLVKEADHDSK